MSNEPKVHLIGNAHLDPIWLWRWQEGCGEVLQTFRSALDRLNEYPDFVFTCSSAAYYKWVEEIDSDMFEEIRERVKEGRWVPVNGWWVQPDCNMPSAESFARQALYSQLYYNEKFGRICKTAYNVDSFGHSGMLPQIIKNGGMTAYVMMRPGAHENAEIPNMFMWESFDGTQIPTFHIPDASGYGSGNAEAINRSRDLAEKLINEEGHGMMIFYGVGNHGGGPTRGLIEYVQTQLKRDGYHDMVFSSPDAFFEAHCLEKVELPVWKDDLQHHASGCYSATSLVKQLNRKLENSLYFSEAFATVASKTAGMRDRTEDFKEAWLDVCFNQFHDILPGTCIPRAHEESRAMTTALITRARDLVKELAQSDKEDCVTVTNTLSFDRSDVIVLDYSGKIVDGGYRQQVYTDVRGNKKLMVGGVTVPAFSSVTLKLVDGKPEGNSVFSLDDNSLETPFASVKFADNGTISSFVDKRADREICGDGYNLNTFIMAEDFPSEWDNWDVDADIEMKFEDVSKLVSREVVSNGSVALVIRSKYAISGKSTVTQDMIFFADSAEVRFDTVMDWQDNHRFLKTAFDTSVRQEFARFDVQFGNVKRPTTRNNSVEKAKFEVLNHKYTDLSETRFGVAVLNDSKYGISVNGGKLRLSLHKGGLRPDFKGDRGVHHCVYSFLPHDSGFDAENVIRPAYELNVPAAVTAGEYSAQKLMSIDADNIFVEAVKPCEDAQRAFIVRMYEAEGTFTNAKVSFFDGAKSVKITNMLEEEQGEVESIAPAKLQFRPFEIKTLKVTY